MNARLLWVVALLGGLLTGTAAAQDEALPPVPPPPEGNTLAPTPPSATPPTTPPDLLDRQLRLEPDPVLRLEGWLQRNSERNETGRVAVSILSIVMGAASIAGAVWAYGLDDTDLRTVFGA